MKTSSKMTMNPNMKMNPKLKRNPKIKMASIEKTNENVKVIHANYVRYYGGCDRRSALYCTHGTLHEERLGIQCMSKY